MVDKKVNGIVSEEEEAKRKVGDNGEPDGTGWSDARPQQSGAYFRVVEGASIQGILEGRFPKPGNRKGFIYQIRTTKPCKALVRVQEGEYEETDIEVGTIVSIDERTALEGLRELLDGEDKYELFIRADEKRKLSNGNNFWDFTIRKRIIQLPF